METAISMHDNVRLEATTATILGLTLAEDRLPPSAGVRLGRTRGLVVESVQQDSLARGAGIEPGDIMAEVDNRPVTTLRELRNILAGHQNRFPLYTLFWSKGRWQLKVLFLD